MGINFQKKTRQGAGNKYRVLGNQSSLRTARKADWGTSTFPI